MRPSAASLAAMTFPVLVSQVVAMAMEFRLREFIQGLGSLSSLGDRLSGDLFVFI